MWSHGDLHDKQIFTADPGAPLGLLDFDEAGRAEAAADLANLAVHLQLRLRQHRLTAERYQTARRHVIATAEELHVTPARFDAYASRDPPAARLPVFLPAAVGGPGGGLPHSGW